MKNWLIYKHTLLVGEHKGWSYIGITQQDINNRWRFGEGYKHQLFYKAIKKYGWENFSHEILETNIDNLEKANIREQYWIAFYHTWIGDTDCHGYNATKGGDGTVGYFWKAESRQKLSVAKTGISHTDDYNARLSKLTGGGKILCIETNTIYYSVGDAYRKTGIRHIQECCSHYRGRTMAGGYHWVRITDQEYLSKFSKFKGKEQQIFKNDAKVVICLELNQLFESIAKAEKFIQTIISSAGKYRANLTRSIKNESLCAGYHWAWATDPLLESKLVKYKDFGQNIIIKKGKKRKIICIETGEVFESLAAAKKIYGPAIGMCLRGKSRTAYKYHWEYVKEL